MINIGERFSFLFRRIRFWFHDVQLQFLIFILSLKMMCKVSFQSQDF